MYWYYILDTWKETLKIDLNFQHHQKNISKFETQTSLNFVPSNKSGKLNVIFYINLTLMSCNVMTIFSVTIKIRWDY